MTQKPNGKRHGSMRDGRDVGWKVRQSSRVTSMTMSQEEESKGFLAQIQQRRSDLGRSK